MRTIIMLATLGATVAAAAPAMAQPTPHDGDRHGRRYDDSYRHRGELRRYRPSWVQLGSLRDLADAGRDSIRVRDRGTFTQLRLQSAGGWARIDRVIIRFADGSSQVARVRGRLGEFIELALDGNNRRIDRIRVVGDASRRGAVTVYGI